ncbi:MAG: hypothetical protein R3249_10115 [Nitriliruptorales bacterium]|nr:hypothetical protein [Nitriliruptorales bacterium]
MSTSTHIPPPPPAASVGDDAPPTAPSPVDGPPPLHAPNRREWARRTWRERLPVLAAWTGAAFVVMSVAGFASSRWALLDPYGQAIALVAAATALSVGSLWTFRSDRAGLVHLGKALWISATAAAIGAVWLAGSEALPHATRVVILVAGLTGVVHAGSQWLRRPDSHVLQFATLASAVYAAGPTGERLSDAFGTLPGEEWFTPIAGFFDPTLGSDAFLLVGIGHLVIGISWLMVSSLLPKAAGTVARISASVLIAYAALALNVLVNPVGAALALVIVASYLIVGIAMEDGLLTVIGSVGALVSGVKVIWSLFTGEVAVTITVFSAGVLMLGWAYQALRSRDA